MTPRRIYCSHCHKELDGFEALLKHSCPREGLQTIEHVPDIQES